MPSTVDAAVWADIYHPVEHKILSEYLDWDPLMPVDGVDIYNDENEEREYVSVVPDEWGDYTDISLPSAVARIALETADEQPVDWDDLYEDEYAEFHQRIRAGTTRPITLSPRYLFSINWANSGPCAWPETYHVTYLLGYRHHVVTATRDTADLFGYGQEAIGYFPGEGLSLLEMTGKVIRDYWKQRWIDGSGSPPWSQFADPGLIPQGIAEDWAIQVWACTEPEFPPDWYQHRLDNGDTGLSAAATEQKSFEQFVAYINRDVPFQDLPEDLRNWLMRP